MTEVTEQNGAADVAADASEPVAASASEPAAEPTVPPAPIELTEAALEALLFVA